MASDLPCVAAAHITQVAATVKASIHNQVKSSLPIIAAHGEDRKKALSAWLKSDAPLAWSEEESVHSGAYCQLLMILKEDPDNQEFELKRSRASLTYMDIAKKIHLMVKKKKIGAPISSSSAFYHALPLAFARMKALLSSKTDKNEDYLIAILARMMKKMNIHFIPWHKSDKSDTQARVVKGDWWLVISNSPLAEINQLLPPEPQEVHAAMAAQVIHNEPDAPWSLTEKLQDMGVLWNKYRLPSDWPLSAASLGASTPGDDKYYIRATYEYFQDNYNGRIWWHHMALVWGILFSKIVPSTFVPRDSNLGPGKATDEVRKLEWTKRTTENRGGSATSLPFITMVSTQIFALLDPKSPLSVYVDQHKQSMGDPWAKKHGNKNIHAINLVHIGLATCERGCLAGPAKYKNNWQMKTLAELRPLYTKVMDFLKKTEGGEYYAMREIFGEAIAIQVGMKKQYKLPGFVSNDQKKTAHSTMATWLSQKQA
ncbi:hypothetical protein JOM56_015381 [Amanita muscaria]